MSDQFTYPTAKEEDPKSFFQIVAEASVQFTDLCEARHLVGIEEYGQFTFLENDIVRMMMEELADTSNYCRMQFIKLMILQNALAGQLEATNNTTLGVEAFKGTKDGWN